MICSYEALYHLPLVLLCEVVAFHLAQAGLALSLDFLSARVTVRILYAQPHVSSISHSNYNLSFAHFITLDSLCWSPLDLALINYVENNCQKTT